MKHGRQLRWAALLLAAGLVVLILRLRATSSSAPVADGPSATDVTQQPKHRGARPMTATSAGAKLAAQGDARRDEIELYGKVTQGEGRELGKAIAGATIQLDTDLRGAHETQSDASGRFRITVALDNFRYLRVEAPGYVGLELRHDQLLSMRRSMQKAPTEPLPFFLRPGSELHGTVEVSGQGIENAAVQCVDAGSHGGPRYSSSVLTDVKGEFAIRCPVAKVKLLAVHADYQRGVSDWIDRNKDPDPRPRIELHSGTRLRGHVVDEDGEPVISATVQVDDLEHQSRALHAWNESRLTLPGWLPIEPDGSFDLGTVSGHLRLTARAANGGIGTVELDLDQEQEKLVELIVKGGITVSGVVTLNGAPRASVMVAWSCEPSARFATTRLSDDDGRFVFRQVKASSTANPSGCAVFALPKGADIFAPQERALGGFLPTRVAARPGDTDVILALETETAATLELSLSGPYERYTGKFRLTPLRQLAATTPVYEQTAYTDVSAIKFTQLRSGTYRVDVDLDNGVDPTAVEVDVHEARDQELIVRIGPGMTRGLASGRVLDGSTQKPIGGVKFWYQNGAANAAFQGVGKPDGRFAFDYAADEISILIKHPGYAPYKKEISVASDDSASFGDIALKPAP